ncbi:MAG: hypothetical protein WC998_00860 [Candidatus Paceibacterota bacterium]|jgi:hypothetical protein
MPDICHVLRKQFAEWESNHGIGKVLFLTPDVKGDKILYISSIKELFYSTELHTEDLTSLTNVNSATKDEELLIRELTKRYIESAHLIVAINIAPSEASKNDLLLHLGQCMGKNKVILLIGEKLSKFFMGKVSGLCRTEADVARFIDQFELRSDIHPLETRFYAVLANFREGV